jgi:hypothetical protein
MNTSLPARKSFMRILEPYDWASNATERSRLESQPSNKLLSAAALELQSYCSRISGKQVERRNTSGIAMTKIRYVSEEELNDENEAVMEFYYTRTYNQLVNSKLLFRLSCQDVFSIWLNLKQDRKNKSTKSKEEVTIRSNCIQSLEVRE